MDKEVFFRPSHNSETLLVDHNSPSDLTHFGFLDVPEREKVAWVRQHFNTVAEKYDFMNTLLSFGIPLETPCRPDDGPARR